jgi:curved DNA-binding protein CbpA
MGAAQSQHLALYSKILKIKSPTVRVQMLQQILSGPEYVAAARQAGVYAALLEYIRRVTAGEAAVLPGEGRNDNVAAQQNRALADAQRKTQIHSRTRAVLQDDLAVVSTDDTKRQRARDIFSMSLYVLGLEDAESLNEDALKAAYKKAALRAHPDKGGSEEAFKEVTRAYTYLSEILKRINGGRKVVEGKVEKPTVLATERSHDADKWKHIEPTRLNAKNLDMNAFNKLFESTRIPDPDEDGYGDWLKDAQAGVDQKKFSGEYNRDVFMRAFEDEITKKSGGGSGNQLSVIHPSAMAMTLQGGTELGRDRPAEYTAAANDRVQYTDLKMAYTRDNTITNHVANVRVEARDYKQYKASREDAPKISAEERAALDEQERELQRREQLRQRRYAQEQVANTEYFERMKQLMIVDKGNN